MNILLGKHHDILAFASKDESRPVLNSVHYNHEKRFLEATDGMILIRVPVKVDEEDAFPPVSINGEAKDCIVPTAAFKKALGNIPKGGNQPILKHLRLTVSGDDEKAKINLAVNDLDTEQCVTVKPMEGGYPDTELVIPKEEPTLTITLSSRILMQIAAYAEKHGKASGSGTAVKLSFTDALSKVRFSFPLENPSGDTIEATGIAMPMRMS